MLRTQLLHSKMHAQNTALTLKDACSKLSSYTQICCAPSTAGIFKDAMLRTQLSHPKTLCSEHSCHTPNWNILCRKYSTRTSWGWKSWIFKRWRSQKKGLGVCKTQWGTDEQEALHGDPASHYCGQDPLQEILRAHSATAGRENQETLSVHSF